MNNDWIVTVSKVAGVEWLLHHMTGSESLGRPFAYNLEILADVQHANLELDKILGQGMTVKLGLPDGRTRYFNGLVSEASFAGLRGQKASFRVTLRPWLWLLSRRSDCRIYQKMNVPDIVQQVFRDAGFSNFKTRLTGNYEVREYCVQYRESHFDFVSRLLEDEGIYYYWAHEDGKHSLVLADSGSAHATAPGYASVVYRSVGEAKADQDHIMEWSLCRQVCTSDFSIDSYDFKRPGSDLIARKNVARQHENAKHERFDYGALYDKSSVGEQYAKVRLQEFNAQQTVARGHANARGIACGALFNFKDYPREDQNREYLIIDAEYFIVNSESETGTGVESASFDVEFSAIESDTPFRPARTTPPAVVRGPQTAVVVGKAGEEIWTDKYGRVKVQFHWDHEGKADENSSCWVRVAHAWAGKRWGTIAIPRIGQEVIVDFLEGDPDQPMITGSVFNENNMPPYTLPDNQTQSGIKTRSTKKGSDKTFNELRFEDKKDSEEIYFHAERDFKRVVQNNDTLTVGLEDKDKGDQEITIHRHRTVTLKEGTDQLTIDKKHRIVKIAKGNDTLDVKKKIAITAGDELTIKVGMSSLTMKKDGTIQLKGKDIKIAGSKSVTIDGKLQVDVKGLKVAIAGQASADVKAPMVSAKADAVLDLNGNAMAKLKGGITMIG